MTDSNYGKELRKVSTEMASNVQEDQKRKYAVGDGVLALWTSDGRWRRGVILNIEGDDAIVTCPEEYFVQPTRVKITNLMPDIASNLKESTCAINRNESEITGDHAKKGGHVEEVFYHKDVEAWMEKIVKHSGNDNKTSSLLSRVALPGNSSLPMLSNHVKTETCHHSPAGSSPTVGLTQNLMSRFDKSQTNVNLPVAKSISNPSILATKPSSPSNLTTMPSTNPYNLATNHATNPGNLATMARTGRGSRYLQSLLVTTPASIPQIYSELMADALSAMTHPKACFVVQKLLDVSDPAAINQIVQIVSQNFSSLSLNQFGCHVVQKTLAVAPNPMELVVQLENYRVLMNMLHSPHGTYVAQACLPLLSPRTTSFIVYAVRGQVVNLGRNQHGTYFLQKMVASNFADGSSVSVIVEQILKHVSELAHDQNGTWLVQAVLKCGDAAVRRLASWVIANLLTVYKSQPAMFLALALVEKLREKCKASQSWAVVLAELVVAMADRHVAGKPLLVVAALHQTGHLLAREVARQVTYLGNGRARDRIVEVVTRYAALLGSDSYGTLVLKGLHEASSCYNLKPLK